jgi:hypothetical protein
MKGGFKEHELPEGERRKKTVNELLFLWRNLHTTRTDDSDCRCATCEELLKHDGLCEQGNECTTCLTLLETYSLEEYHKKPRRTDSPIGHLPGENEGMRKMICWALQDRLGIRSKMARHRIVRFPSEVQR